MRWTRTSKGEAGFEAVIAKRHSRSDKIVVAMFVVILAVILLPLLVELVMLALGW